MNRRVPNVMLSTSRNWFLTILHFYLRQHVLRFVMFIGWLVRSFVNMCWGQMSWKWLEIEAWLQWSTYRKWHTTNGMVALSMMSRDPLWAGGVSLTWRRLRPLTAFYSSSRYVPNVAKRSIWDQCKKGYILTTDRPTDRPLIWPILGKFHMAISPRGVVRWSTSCLVLRWGFRGRRIEWLYFRFDQIQWEKTTLEEYSHWSQSKVFLVYWLIYVAARRHICFCFMAKSAFWRGFSALAPYTGVGPI